MKKSNLIFAAIISFAAIALTSCGKTADTVTSSFTEGHITVQQTTSGIRLVIKKTADEDIKKVTVVDAEEGHSASSSFGNALSTSFAWPFVEKGKEYTLNAQLFGDEAYSEETVTFKVDNDCSSILKYTDAYLNSKMKLIADGDKRLVKLETTKDNLTSILAGKNIGEYSLKISVYSGSRKDISPQNLVGISNLTTTMSDDVMKILTGEGYDLIAKASDFGHTDRSIDAEFCKNQKYFGSAIIYFTLKDGEENIEYGTKPIYTNDTIYTPVDFSSGL